MSWVDAAMVSAAIGLTAFTVFLCAAEDPEAPPAATDPAALPSALDPDLPLIVLHESGERGPCASAVAAEKEAGRDLHISLDHPDRTRLVEFLAGVCRGRRIPPERIVAHRQLEAGRGCGGSIRPELLVGDVRREMMR